MNHSSGVHRCTIRAAAALISLTLSAPRAVAAQERHALAPDVAQRVDSLVRAQMARQRIPGLSLAIAAGNVVRLERGYGLADVENAVPATAQTSYRMASIAKPITATAVMRLVELGRMELDAPVQRYAPAFPTKQWPITVRQLLTHTSGMRHYRQGELVGTRAYADVGSSLVQFRDDPLLFSPGTSFLYSSFGYVLLGAAIEGAAGMPYAAFVAKRIFGPAGMRSTRVDRVADVVRHRASGYRLIAGDSLVNAPLADVTNKVPAGGLRSTAGDLARFAVALGSDALLRRASVEAMWTPAPPLAHDEAPLGVGLGWRVTTHQGRREVWHDGEQPQVSTVLYLRPDRGTVVAVMANLERVNSVELARAIANTVESR